MRIYHARVGDPMLIGAASTLSALADAIEAFLASSCLAADFVAETNAPAEPADELLPGLRVTKGNGQQLTISDDRWLELRASPAYIRSFATLLREPSD
jgi:hypothetical protein